MHAESDCRAGRALSLCRAACRLTSDCAIQSMAVKHRAVKVPPHASPEMMCTGLAMPVALTSSCWLGAAAPVWSSGACSASKSEDSTEDSGTDLSDLASDSEELYSEGDIGMAELKELQVCLEG